MLDNNNHLVEVLCGMRFDSTKNEWDSTFFGKFHDRISQYGFVEKEERKEFRVEFNLNKKVPIGNPGVEETGIKMVFKNPIQKSAITLSEGYISFHKLAPYENWDDLINTIAKPILKEYKELGIGNGIVEVQCLYLNKFEVSLENPASNYFHFLPEIINSSQKNILFQSKYDLGNNSIINLSLRGNFEQSKGDLFFECSCSTTPLADEDVFDLASISHTETNKVFKSVYKNK